MVVVVVVVGVVRVVDGVVVVVVLWRLSVLFPAEPGVVPRPPPD